MSMWVMRGASQIKLPYPMPLTINLAPDGRVLFFTLCLTAFTGLAFGLVPALQATRADLSPALKDGGAIGIRRHRRLSLRNLLMLSQVGGSLTLLLITGFLLLGFLRTMGTEVGFDATNLYLISLDPVRDGYSGEQAAAFFPKLLDRVKLLPSITAAGLADTTPMAMMGKPAVTLLNGRRRRREGDSQRPQVRRREGLFRDHWRPDPARPRLPQGGRGDNAIGGDCQREAGARVLEG